MIETVTVTVEGKYCPNGRLVGFQAYVVDSSVNPTVRLYPPVCMDKTGALELGHALALKYLAPLADRFRSESAYLLTSEQFDYLYESWDKTRFKDMIDYTSWIIEHADGLFDLECKKKGVRINN